jgi:hypothetical protein
MAKDQQKAARQSYASKAKDRGHRAHKFMLEGFAPNMSADMMNLNTAIAMSARNKSKIVGGAREYEFNTPTLL